MEALIAEDLSTSSHENTNTAKGLALDASGAHLEEIKEQFSLIEERALKAEQDTEYEASITAERAEVSTRLSKEEERAARIKVMEKKPT